MQTRPSFLRHPFWLAILYGIALWSLSLGWMTRAVPVDSSIGYIGQTGLKAFPASIMVFVIIFYGAGVLTSLIHSFLLEEWFNITLIYKVLYCLNMGLLVFMLGSLFFIYLAGYFEDYIFLLGFWLWVVTNFVALTWLWWRVYRPFKPVLYGDETLLDDNPE